jgi:hypothetical protein
LRLSTLLEIGILIKKSHDSFVKRLIPFASEPIMIAILLNSLKESKLLSLPSKSRPTIQNPCFFNVSIAVLIFATFATCTNSRQPEAAFAIVALSAGELWEGRINLVMPNAAALLIIAPIF